MIARERDARGRFVSKPKVVRRRSKGITRSEGSGRELLLAWLNDTQRNEFKAYGRFHVVSYDGQRRYLIHNGRAPQLVSIKSGALYTHKWRDRMGYYREVCAGYAYCIHMPDVTWDDYHLAMAMLLSDEQGEKTFHRIANW